MVTLRQLLVSGFIVVTPIVITLIAVAALLRAIVELTVVASIQPAYLRPPAVLIVFALLVLAVGYLMRTAVGTVIAGTIANAINRVPILRVVYNASHWAIETVLSEDGERTEPVLVETWKGFWATAFTTGKRAPDGRLICFLPTAPNVTTGYVIEVRDEDVIFTGERVERALTRLLSAGFGESRDGFRHGAPVEGGTARPRRIRAVHETD